MTACDACLARAELLGMLGARIQALVQRASAGTRGLLALGNEDLVRAIAPKEAEAVLARLAEFDADDMRERAAEASLAVVCRHREGYPEALRAFPDAPHAIFVRTHTDVFETLVAAPSVAIVGSRGASKYALEVAQDLGRALSIMGVTVVSGLALGVDAAAHRGALLGGGRTIAVLASGADVASPRTHTRLYERVADAGAVIAEMPPGTEPRPWAFPARNRIMAGLASLVIVVEAGERSGTLITAGFALAMGRELGAVPGRVNSRRALGSNRLLFEGAAMIRDAQDALDLLFGVGMRPLPPAPEPKLDAATRAVLDAVEAGEPPDGAAQNLSARDVRAALGRLEVLGLVRRDGLGGYERTRCVAA